VAAKKLTVRQRELGKRLREVRNERGMTVEDVAERLSCPATKISRLEAGARRPNLRDLRDLCALYDVDEPTRADFIDLARTAHESVWWTSYEDLQLDPYLGLEQDAAAITSYTTYYIPALLQTEEYTRRVISAIAPKMNPDIYRQRVEVRMRRQQVLERRDRPHYGVLLDEAVLHRRVGDPAIMVTQLDKILEAERDSKVVFQVIPFGAGILAAQDSNFVLLEFTDESNMVPIVFVEGLIGNQYYEHNAEIVRYREAVEYLRASALSPAESVRRVIEQRDSYAGFRLGS
jgi:transcriptional regulator with XRE-family HTH domain